MRGNYSTVFFIVLFLFSGIISDAQNAKNKSFKTDNFTGAWLFGVTIGPNFFHGDLNVNKILPDKNVSVSGGVFASRQITHVIGFKTQFLFGGLSGKKAGNLDSLNSFSSFSGTMMDITLNTTINFSNLISKYKPSRRFFIYGTVGFGLAGWRTQMNEMVNDVEILNVPRTWGSAIVFPIGLGAFYSVTSKINVGMEWIFRIVMSDHVDQVVGGFRYDIDDYLAFGVSFNLGKSGKKSMKVHDYPYPVVTPAHTETFEKMPLAEPPANTVTPPEPGDYVYVVQIFAFAKYKHSAESIRRKYRIAQQVKRDLEDGVYRYTLGNFKDLEFAKELRSEMIRKGIHDTFIIAYKDGVRHHTVTE